MTICAEEAAPRPREDSIVIEPGSATYLVATLREGEAGTARSFAWFGAATTENHLRGLPGFRGAAFMVADDDRHSFEITQWDSEAALDGARRDQRSDDYSAILRAHGAERQVVASADLHDDAPFLFARGDVLVLTTFALPDAPADLAGGGKALALVVPESEGGWGISIARVGHDLLPAPDGPRGDGWRATMRVVEVVSGEPAAANRHCAYRLLPVTSARSAPDGEHAHG